MLTNLRDLCRLITLRGPLTPAELAGLTGIPRPTVYRAVSHLVDTGLLRPGAEGTVDLGLRWLRLGEVARAARTEWDPAREAMAKVACRTGCTVYLSLRLGDTAVCLDWAPGRDAETLVLRPGRRVDLHTGGTGRVLLASLDDGELNSYLARAPLQARTPATLVTEAQIKADVEVTRSRGYVHARDDVTLGVSAIAVAVRAKRSIGAIAMTSLTADVDARDLELVDEARRAAKEAMCG